jgi:hypothetical protein
MEEPPLTQTFAPMRRLRGVASALFLYFLRYTF